MPSGPKGGLVSYLNTLVVTACGAGGGVTCACSVVSEVRTANSTVANRNPIFFTFCSSGTSSAFDICSLRPVVPVHGSASELPYERSWIELQPASGTGLPKHHERKWRMGTEPIRNGGAG